MARETLEVTAPPTPPEVSAEPPLAEPAQDTPDDIEARLLTRQQALAGKLDVLEQQTLGSIRDTIGTVTDTVNSVQAVVADPMGAMQSAVMNPIGSIAGGVTTQVTDMIQKLDPSAMVRRYPLESVGVAVAGGVVLSMLLSARPTAGAVGGPPSLFQSITGGFRDELVALGRQLLGTVAESLKERVKEAVSSFPQHQPPPKDV